MHNCSDTDMDPKRIDPKFMTKCLGFSKILSIIHSKNFPVLLLFQSKIIFLTVQRRVRIF